MGTKKKCAKSPWNDKVLFSIHRYLKLERKDCFFCVILHLGVPAASMATERCGAWSCIWCWPKLGDGRDVPARPWALGLSLHGPRPVCFSGWGMPFASTPLCLTKNVNIWRTHCTFSVRAVYASVNAQTEGGSRRHWDNSLKGKYLSNHLLKCK